MQEDLGKITLWIGIYLNIISDNSFEIEKQYHESI